MKTTSLLVLTLLPVTALATELTAPFSQADIETARTALRSSNQLQSTLTDSLGTTYALIPAGSFTAGSKAKQLEKANSIRPDWWSDDHAKESLSAETPLVSTTITKPFYLATTETTIRAFREFVHATKHKTEPQSDGKGGMYYDGGKHQSPDITWFNPKPGTPITDTHPVTQVTHADALAFCDWLSEKDQATYRLPTEAEWEYATRAGTTTLWHFGDDPAALPNYAATGKAPSPVASKKPNPFGLYDTYGNVWELTGDHFVSTRSAPFATDPTGPPSGQKITRRGGNFASGPTEARSAFRKGSPLDYRGLHVGFRILREIAD